MPSDKTLPKDSDSDYSLPGRYEEGNSENSGVFPEPFNVEPVEQRSKNKPLIIVALVFVVVSAGVFTYYFSNQPEIDSQILQNTYNLTPEEQLVLQYGVGKFGSDHAHAAIAVFIGDEKINFARPQYQLTSQYIHFENHNPYLIHRHATNVPLDLLFASFGMWVSTDCMILNGNSATSVELCSDQQNSLEFYINGQKVSEVSQYVVQQNDRIVISYGDNESIEQKIDFMETLQIPDVPRNTPQLSKDEILI